ncbi:hypothetical protein E2C01_091692 [Portunus trituberculatus]|uniref:Uncharacterized protein n=1 Tax=Portunus trituberculatus TaxID=210409 RepID=A0A5B7JVR5_PORTR|nr:hypothetical protein [Portunus trituberculatus]
MTYYSTNQYLTEFVVSTKSIPYFVTQTQVRSSEQDVSPPFRPSPPSPPPPPSTPSCHAGDVCHARKLSLLQAPGR